MILRPPVEAKQKKGSFFFIRMVGDMLLKGLFLGSIEFRLPGLGSKSCISSFKRIPVFGTIIPEPKKHSIVSLIATMFPSLSTAQKVAVSLPS